MTPLLAICYTWFKVAQKFFMIATKHYIHYMHLSQVAKLINPL